MESRRERKKSQTRLSLLNAAMALFAEGGIQRTRVEDITERADLGKGAFYNYFPSKDALIGDLVARGVTIFEEGYLAQMNGTTGVAERVSELVELHTRFLDEHPEFALLFHQARGLLLQKDSRVERLREAFTRYLSGVGHALAKAPLVGNWSEGELLDIAAALVGGVSGYRSYRAAVALAPGESTAQEILVYGIPGLVESRHDSPGRSG